VKLLLEYDADKEAKNNYGSTPLIRACANGYAETVKLLLEYGADKEAKNKYGSTPLIWASWNENTEIVKLLLEYGADINIYHSQSNTCLDYYKEIWDEESIQELIINNQPHNIKLFDVKIGILPQLREKYKEIIELTEIGLF